MPGRAYPTLRSLCRQDLCHAKKARRLRRRRLPAISISHHPARPRVGPRARPHMVTATAAGVARDETQLPGGGGATLPYAMVKPSVSTSGMEGVETWTPFCTMTPLADVVSLGLAPLTVPGSKVVCP